MRLSEQIAEKQLDVDVRQAIADLATEHPRIDPQRLTNAEKAEVITSLRGKWKLNELLSALDMAKSSYEYARKALSNADGKNNDDVRQAVIAAFEASGGTHGYRRIVADINAKGEIHVGEWTVRSIMNKEGLVARPNRKDS